MGKQLPVRVMMDDIERFEQPAASRNQGGLLVQFAQSRRDDGLAALDLAPRITPQSRIGRVTPLHQQDRAIPRQDRDGGRHGPLYDHDSRISIAATCSKQRASASEKRLLHGLSMSSTPTSTPSRISGTTISERELASQAMWPANA